MTSFLNAYRNFIDVSTREGLTLLSNATDKFDPPLKDDDRINLRSGGHDYQKLKDTLLRCSQKFGYQHLLNNVPTRRIVTPAVPAVVADPTAVPPVLAAVLVVVVEEVDAMLCVRLVVGVIGGIPCGGGRGVVADAAESY